MKDLRYILNETLYAPFVGEPGSGAVFEGLLDPDMDTGITAEVELKSILKKHRCSYSLANYSWKNKTLRLSFNRGEYMYDLQGVADELRIKSFEFYPRVIIRDTPALEDMCISAETMIQIDCPCKIDNCILQDGMGVHDFGMGIRLTADDQGRLDMKHTTINCYKLTLKGVNKANLQGNNFDKVRRLVLTNVGPNIQKIIGRWNICVLKNGRICSTSRGGFNHSMDPVKELGLDKHFKNLEELCIATGTDGNDLYICCEKRNLTHKPGTWGVMNLKELDNGWSMCLLDDARSL